jgi:hypothetical protein
LQHHHHFAFWRGGEHDRFGGPGHGEHGGPGGYGPPR